MIYEVLKSKGLKDETKATVSGIERNWRMAADLSTFIIKYKDERPDQYDGYEILFKGDSQQVMEWLHPKQAEWGVTMDPKPVRLVSAPEVEIPEATSIPEPETATALWKIAAALGAAAAAAGGIYYYLS